MRSNGGYDTRAWLIWLLSAAAMTVAARNPLYSILLLLASRAVEWSQGRSDSALNLRLGPVSVLNMGALVLLFSGLFTALFVHVGNIILITIPERIPLIGGPVTLEALLAGMSNGLLLLTLLSFFVAFNRVLTADRLARLAPRAFQDLGIVVLVALTYVPETARHVQRIREAQAIRGLRINGLRDWRPLLIPLLIGGLERAMALAEAMVARGFGATGRTPLSRQMIAALTLSLGLTFSGWIAALWWGIAGWIVMAAGILLLATLLWSAGRHVTVTQYRAQRWRSKDSLMLLASLAPLTILLLPPENGIRQSLVVSFLDGLAWPAFDPFAGFLLVLYAFPAFAGLLEEAAVFEESYDHG